MKMQETKNIDEYIARFSEDIQRQLSGMRAAIHKAAPQSTETIKYGMPTFEQQGNLVHFAAFKNHIGFYPAPAGIQAFKKELSKYAQSKGTIRFSLDEPLPLSLIARIVKYRVRQNLEKAKIKHKGKLKAHKRQS